MSLRTKGRYRARISVLLLWVVIISRLLSGSALAFLQPPVDEPEPASEREQVNELPILRFTNSAGTDMNEYVGVSVSMTDIYGQEVLRDENAQWRWHGNSTRNAPKLPYKFKLSKKADLLGTGAGRKWILLANAFDKTLLRNKLMYELAGELGLAYVSSAQFVELYIDGVYKGNYLLTEPVEYGRDRVNLYPAKDEFILELEYYQLRDVQLISTERYHVNLSFDGLEEVPQEQMEEVSDFLRRAEDALATGEQEKIARYFDIDSFMNVYILNEFSKNADTRYASTRFYLKDGLLYAGPPWDYDLSCGATAANEDRLYYYNNTQPAFTEGWYACSVWWNALCRLDWFQELFAERYMALQPLLVNLYQDNELGKNRIDALVEAMPESIEHNYSRWPVYGTYFYVARYGEASYEENVEYLRSWLKERNLWLLNEIKEGRPDGSLISVFEQPRIV